MKLWTQVQYHEQRLLMLEQYMLELALHMNKPTAHSPQMAQVTNFPTYRKPSYQHPQRRLDEVIGYPDQNEQSDFAEPSQDFGSPDSYGGYEGETGADVSGVGGFGDPSSDGFGDDFGSSDSDASSDSGDAADAGGSDGGMD